MAEIRLQKLIAEAGLRSRRTAEEWIASGRVRVNGETAVLGTKADPEQDNVMVDGEPLGAREHLVYLMLNKPRGYVTTLSDEKKRMTVADLVTNAGARVFPVGRLDLDSEGLLLMTNDGDLMQHLLHPKFEISKAYQLWVFGDVRQAAERLAAVTDLEGEPIRQAMVDTLRQSGGTAELKITIHEGKNRQIRRMCAQCGLIVKRLRRIKEDGLELGDLQPGSWRYLTEAEVAALKRT